MRGEQPIVPSRGGEKGVVGTKREGHFSNLVGVGSARAWGEDHQEKVICLEQGGCRGGDQVQRFLLAGAALSACKASGEEQGLTSVLASVEEGG